MTAHASDLVVRRHDRYECDLPALLTVIGTAVRLSRSVLGGAGKLPARVVDISGGGIGMISAVYLPPGCEVDVELQTPGDGSRAGNVKLRLRLRRTAMADRKPSFYLGAGFDGEDPGRDAAVAKVVAALRASGAKLVPERASA
jgi:hypothetical protein